LSRPILTYKIIAHDQRDSTFGPEAAWEEEREEEEEEEDD